MPLFYKTVQQKPSEDIALHDQNQQGQTIAVEFWENKAKTHSSKLGCFLDTRIKAAEFGLLIHGMVLQERIFQMRSIQMRINLRSRDTGMTKHILNST